MSNANKTSQDDKPLEASGETGSQQKNFLQSLGPGLITGAADDDPSGIATYSQAGARFGYGMLWMMVLCYPLMTSIQQICARLGRVTGRGLAGNMHRYPAWLMYSLVGLLLTANVINIGADIAAMGAAMKLLVGGPALVYSVVFGVTSLLLQIFVPYAKYVKFLKWLTLALFAYVATVLVVHVPWGEALRATALPSISWNAKFISTFIAVIGTTISPYLFFWQASEEAEEVHDTPGETPLKRAPQQAVRQLRRIKMDTYIGMAFANFVAYAIMLTCAVTLHQKGITEIETAAQAAEALRPLAGRFAFLLFATGIIGTGLLAVPVLAGSAAFAVGEALYWRVGLERKAQEAKGFYGVLTAAILLGVALNFTAIDPIKALFWTAVINGVVAVPVMVVVMLMATNPKVMTEEFTLSPGLKFMGWLTTAVMLAAVIGLFATWGKA